MEDATGVIYDDVFTMAFNIFAYRLVKHLLATPFIIATIVLLGDFRLGVVDQRSYSSIVFLIFIATIIFGSTKNRKKSLLTLQL
jgi:hypothetical protein